MKPERELGIRHDYANVGEVRLHYAECGSGEDLVILLHGFPEFWYSWRYQLPVLGKRYHVVAPDMRGFNLSDKPPRKSDYVIEKLVGDVLGLIKHFGKSRAAIVAHDWGAGVAWALAQRHPEAVSKLAALQVPPPAAWRDNMTFAQLRRSWYMFFFQLPFLPERWAAANDFARVGKMYRETSFRADAFSDEDIEIYKAALRRPGALTSSLNYYRANVLRSLFRRGVETPSEGDGRIRVPTLFIYGELDVAVIPATVQKMEKYFDAPYSEHRIAGSGHWVQSEAREEVNDVLMKFLEN
ncbi:MAG TPA: alpha/beta hydrolase [Candidatus Eisenbacteria bacterium]|nr:alpha/beta hydrolase [Candidatus Eisenbacteria bacterium]